MGAFVCETPWVRGEGVADLTPGDGLPNCSDLTRGEGIEEEKRDLNKNTPRT